MAKCRFCGKPVTTSPVHHSVCWEKAALEAAAKFCDRLCKLPGLYRGDEAELLEHCDKECPVWELVRAVQGPPQSKGKQE